MSSALPCEAGHIHTPLLFFCVRFKNRLTLAFSCILDINMVSPAFSLVWFLAVFGVAEATAKLSERHLVPYGPRLHSRSTDSTFQRKNAPTGMADDDKSGTDKNGAAKVLQYSLQEEPVNGTALRRRMRSRVTTPSKEGDSTLEKRENWDWKHLEDYRGYLYFIESTSSASPGRFQSRATSDRKQQTNQR